MSVSLDDRCVTTVDVRIVYPIDCWFGLNRVVTSEDKVLFICLNQRAGL